MCVLCWVHFNADLQRVEIVIHLSNTLKCLNAQRNPCPTLVIQSSLGDDMDCRESLNFDQSLRFYTNRTSILHTVHISPY